MSWANSGAVVAVVQTTGAVFVAVDRRVTWVPWVTSYPPLGSRSPCSTATPSVSATCLIVVERPGDAR